MTIDKETIANYRFIFLLVSLVALLVIPPYWEGENKGAATGVFTTTIMISFLLLVAKKRWELAVGITLAVPVLMLSWSGVSVSGGTVYFYLILFNIAFYVFVVLELIRYIVANKEVDFNLIAAAISVYFLLGIIWTFIYLSIELRVPGSIFISGLTDSSEAFSRLMYFSFVTMTTLGYGDVLPKTTITQHWVVLQSITGQFFIAILVARLVALYSTSNRSSEED